MGVTIGSYLNNGSGGWSVIAPSGSPQDGFNGSAPPSGNTMKIYVSSSTGKDPGDAGFVAGTAGSQATPYRTVHQGMSVVRSGEADWCLFKRGDTFTNENFNGGAGQVGSLNQFPCGLAGGALPATAPMVLRDYGTGARPLFDNHPGAGTNVIGSSGGSRSTMNRAAVIGLEFTDSTRNPLSANFDLTGAASQAERTCFSWANSFDFLLIEDCKFSYFAGNLAIEPDINSPPYSGTGFYFRRNVVLNAYPALGRSQGMFIGNVSADGWIYEENVLDSNGWNTTLTQNVSATITQAAPGVVSFSMSLAAGAFTPANGSSVIFAQSGGGITAGTIYLTLNKSGNTFQISTDGVTPINTSAGLVSPQTVNWVDPAATGANRNCYISDANGLTGKGITRGNTSCRSSSDGIQVRPGGDVYNNLFARNAFTGHTGGGSNQSDTPLTLSYLKSYDNVIIDTQQIQTFPPSGDGNGIDIVNLQGTVVIGPDNVISRGVGSGAGAINFDKDVLNGQAYGNVIFSYVSGASSNGTGGVTSQGVSVVDAGGSGYNNSDPNFFQQVHTTNISGSGAGSGLMLWVRTAGGAVVQVLPDGIGQNYHVGDVIGIDPTTGGMGGVGSGFQTAIRQVGTTTTGQLGPNTVDLAGTQPYPPGWTDPNNRTVEVYDAVVLGGPGTFDHFISLASQQGNGNWNPAVTADAVVDWIQLGFGIGTGNQLPFPRSIM